MKNTNIKTMNIKCQGCNTFFDKPIKDINRNLKLGRRNYCSHKCTGIGTAKFKRMKKHLICGYIVSSRKVAIRRNYDFNLTEENLLNMIETQEYKCKISGVKIYLRERNGKKNLKQASIDRLDCSKGYTIDNIQFVALGINYMRNDTDLEEAINFLEYLKNSGT